MLLAVIIINSFIIMLDFKSILVRFVLWKLFKFIFQWKSSDLASYCSWLQYIYCMKNVCYFPGIHHGPSLYADRRNNSWNIADHKSTRTSLMKNLHLFSYISALIAYLTFPFLMVIRPDWTMIYEFLDSSWWNGIRMYSIKCKF